LSAPTVSADDLGGFYANDHQGAGHFSGAVCRRCGPFNSLKSIAEWAAGLGYKGVQIPTWDGRLFDLKKAASSKTYCDEVKGVCADAGVEITELSTHLQGQLVAVHPAYDLQFDGFAPAKVHGNPKARQKWAVEQMMWGAKASRNLGLNACVSFTGALAFPYLYPWPQRPQGLIEEAFGELGKRWKPILDAYDDAGVDLGYEIHPGEDVFDGATFEMFLEAVGGHSAARSITTRLTSSCSSSIIWPSSTSITSASRRSTSRTPSSTRPAVRASIPAIRLGRSRRPFPFAGRRTGRFRRHLLQAHGLQL
jgi:sugar phosphate isomerase/epimerase